ncbi:hypothetical protein [Emticicia sp. 17c]|uniref:hypothetical protein n=1 Tax=Emticicia sp. 17c TaxID=3127704 RepID=UPI00301C9128
MSTFIHESEVKQIHNKISEVLIEHQINDFILIGTKESVIFQAGQFEDYSILNGIAAGISSILSDRSLTLPSDLT